MACSSYLWQLEAVIRQGQVGAAVEQGRLLITQQHALFTNVRAVALPMARSSRNVPMNYQRW